MASRCFVSFLDGQLVGFCAVLPMPNAYLRNSFRIHRLVVLPDFQGMGIATKMLKYVTSLYEDNGCNMYIRTSHVKLKNYFEKSDEWIETNRSGKPSTKMKGLTNWKIDENRIAYAFKHKNDKVNQDNKRSYENDPTIFDLI